MALLSTGLNWNELMAEVNKEEKKRNEIALPKGAATILRKNNRANMLTQKAKRYENALKNVAAVESVGLPANVKSHIASYLSGYNKMSVGQQTNALKTHINELKKAAAKGGRRQRKTRRHRR